MEFRDDYFKALVRTSVGTEEQVSAMDERLADLDNLDDLRGLDAPQQHQRRVLRAARDAGVALEQALAAARVAVTEALATLQSAS